MENDHPGKVTNHATGAEGSEYSIRARAARKTRWISNPLSRNPETGDVQKGELALFSRLPNELATWQDARIESVAHLVYVHPYDFQVEGAIATSTMPLMAISGLSPSASFASDIAGAISGCTSIDADRNDNGFLACAAGKNPAAGSHGSTAQAVANLVACLGGGGKPGNIVGHGNKGLIVTGTGDEATHPDKYIHLSNPGYWEPYLKQLKGKLTQLLLWACHPGTGAEGADFLYNIAKIVGVPVAGPTGFVYCGGGQPDLFLEAGSVWQVATPTTRPNPIEAPSPFFTQLSMDILLTAKGEVVTRRHTSEIVEATVTRRRGQEAGSFRLDAQDARGFLELVRFDAPFTPGGVPAALVTARLEIRFDDGEVREFVIYNDMLLQDTQDTGTFFHATPALGTALSSLLR